MTKRRPIVPLLLLIFLLLVAQRVWRSANLDPHQDTMPAGASLAEAEEIYLAPGGRYTEADIEANGRQIAAEKYRGFRARHDANPAAGERLCPVTRTKANPECTWIVDGQVYAFCCPPCIDEFVRLAKESPDELQAPAAYVKR